MMVRGGQSPLIASADRQAAAMDFTWTGIAQAAFYRLEIESASGGQILSAVLPRGVTGYGSPSWLKERAGDGSLRWRVLALDESGVRLSETAWRSLLQPKLTERADQ